MVRVSDQRVAAWRSATREIARVVGLVRCRVRRLTVYGAFAWLIGFDAEPLVHGWGDLSRVLGSLPG
jgi:hypothetical protein